MEFDVDARVAALERTNRRFRAWLLPVAIVWLVSIGLVVGGFLRSQSQALAVGDSLVVREIVVVDSQGTVRVRLGAHLPDAVVNGRTVARGEDATGILLYDDTGRERSGYVTFAPSRNVALTLDTRDRQVALFAADPSDGVAARLWGGSNWVDLRADTKGAHLNIGRANELVVQQPPMTEEEEAAGCAELTEELRQIAPPPPIEQVLAACNQHMPDAACRRCLRVP